MTRDDLVLFLLAMHNLEHVSKKKVDLTVYQILSSATIKRLFWISFEKYSVWILKRFEYECFFQCLDMALLLSPRYTSPRYKIFWYQGIWMTNRWLIHILAYVMKMNHSILAPICITRKEFFSTLRIRTKYLGFFTGISLTTWNLYI